MFKPFKSFLVMSILSQGGYMNLFGPRFRIMNPEGDEGGGDGGGGGEGGGDGKPGADGKYPKEFVDKLLREKNNFKTKATELETKLNEALKAKPAPKEGEDDKSKELLRAMDTENKDLKKKLEDRENERKDAIKLGTLKQEFVKNGGDDKSWELVQRLAETGKVMIDEDTEIVYGAEAEMKRIKELAPQLFGTPKVKVKDGDLNQDDTHSAPKGDLDKLKTMRTGGKAKDREATKTALVDFYAANGIMKR